MAKDDMIELEGTVVESLPNTMFSVDIVLGRDSTTVPSSSIRSSFAKFN